MRDKRGCILSHRFAPYIPAHLGGRVQFHRLLRGTRNMRYPICDRIYRGMQGSCRCLANPNLNRTRLKRRIFRDNA